MIASSRARRCTAALVACAATALLSSCGSVEGESDTSPGPNYMANDIEDFSFDTDQPAGPEPYTRPAREVFDDEASWWLADDFDRPECAAFLPSLAFLVTSDDAELAVGDDEIIDFSSVVTADALLVTSVARVFDSPGHARAFVADAESLALECEDGFRFENWQTRTLVDSIEVEPVESDDRDGVAITYHEILDEDMELLEPWTTYLSIHRNVVIAIQVDSGGRGDKALGYIDEFAEHLD